MDLVKLPQVNTILMIKVITVLEVKVNITGIVKVIDHGIQKSAKIDKWLLS